MTDTEIDTEFAKFDAAINKLKILVKKYPILKTQEIGGGSNLTIGFAEDFHCNPSIMLNMEVSRDNVAEVIVNFNWAAHNGQLAETKATFNKISYLMDFSKKIERLFAAENLTMRP